MAGDRRSTIGVGSGIRLPSSQPAVAGSFSPFRFMNVCTSHGQHGPHLLVVLYHDCKLPRTERAGIDDS